VPRVCVIGSANVDYTVALPRLPSRGETVSGGTLLVNLGGKGANQAVAARRLGGEVRMIGCVGDDTDGRRIRESLAAAGIGVDGLSLSREAATGTALIMVDAQGHNQIAVAPGANHRLTVEMVAPHAEQPDGEREERRAEQRQRRDHADLEGRQSEREEIDRQKNRDEAVAEVANRPRKADVCGSARHLPPG